MLSIGVLASAHVPSSGAWLPSDLPALAAWYDAADSSTITASGSTTTQWRDKSGNARHLNQGSVGLHPSTGTRSLNGLNVLDFLNDLMSTAAFTTNQPYTLAWVGQFDDVSGTAVPVSMRTNNAYGVYSGLTSGTGYWRIFNGALLEAPVTATTTPHVFVGIHNAGSSSIRLDGSSIASGAVGTQTGTHLVVGGYSLTNSAFDGCIGEVVLVSGVLAGADLTNLETYLADKWGL